MDITLRQNWSATLYIPYTVVGQLYTVATLYFMRLQLLQPTFTPAWTEGTESYAL